MHVRLAKLRSGTERQTEVGPARNEAKGNRVEDRLKITINFGCTQLQAEYIGWLGSQDAGKAFNNTLSLYHACVQFDVQLGMRLIARSSERDRKDR